MRSASFRPRHSPHEWLSPKHLHLCAIKGQKGQKEKKRHKGQKGLKTQWDTKRGQRLCFSGSHRYAANFSNARKAAVEAFQLVRSTKERDVLKKSPYRHLTTWIWPILNDIWDSYRGMGSKHMVDWQQWVVWKCPCVVWQVLARLTCAVKYLCRSSAFITSIFNLTFTSLRLDRNHTPWSWSKLSSTTTGAVRGEPSGPDRWRVSKMDCLKAMK